MTKIIDNLNKHYTKPEELEAGDWFYDEITRKYYQIVKNAGYYAVSRPDNGTVGVLCTSIKDTFGTHDTSRLVKISPDQVPGVRSRIRSVSRYISALLHWKNIQLHNSKKRLRAMIPGLMSKKLGMTI